MPARSVQRPQMQVVNAVQVPPLRRVLRKPRHSFNLKSKPFEIVPFMCAPVLANDTMESLLMQVNVDSDPVQNRRIGWWKEYYFCYVPLPGMSDWDTSGLLKTMHLDPATDVSTLKAAANSTTYYTYKGGMNYVEKCVETVIKEWFRDEGEAVNAASIENYYAAQINNDTWLQNLKLESATGDDTELPGVDPMEEFNKLSAFSTEYDQWEIMRDAGIVDATFEDYLRAQGVNVPQSEDQGESPDRMYAPELLRFVRDWKMPVYAVQASDGAVKAALRWQLAERADKARYFKYPGFIVGVTVTRPKLYYGNQKGAAVGFLDDAYAWLPRILDGHPYSSVDEIVDSATDGIFQNQNEDYWFDKRDLFLHGDQFVNWTMSAANNHALALPVTNTLAHKYPTDLMVESLFVTAGSEYIYEDGVVHLNIKSRLRDSTPG